MDEKNEVENFYRYLFKTLKYPPYFLIAFCSGTFVLASIITDRFFVQTFITFLYSVGGLIWRHATKDIRGRIEKLHGKDSDKFKNENLWLTGIYQVINIILVIILIIVEIYTSSY